jgi:proline dehydrogenase
LPGNESPVTSPAVAVPARADPRSRQKLRVELLATLDCPHADRAEQILRAALEEAGYEPSVDRVYVSDLDNAAGLGFHGSPTIRIEGQDVVPVGSTLPIGLGCRLYQQPGGGVFGVVPASTITAALERHQEAEAAAEAARTHLRDVPSRVSRAFFLWASRRHSLESLATAIPLTRSMVRRFVPGAALRDALTALDVLRDQGMTWTVDVLGESVDSRDTALASADRYIETLDALAAGGLDPNVSLKLTQMGLDIDHDFCLENVGRVVARAKEIGAFVRIDMEDHTKTDVTLEFVRELNGVHREVGAVIQSYLRRSADDIDRLNSSQIRVRLCKGAYDEPAAVAFKSREEVDESYKRLTEKLLLDGRYPALATHDDQLIEHALRFVAAQDISPDKYEFQMLYGIRRDLQQRLVAMGQTVRVYVPYGTQWYPYYMRRLAERPQNVLFILGSVLREGRSDLPSDH